MPLPAPEALALRAQALRAIRDFFDTRDFVEVETPLRFPAPANELHIDAPACGDHWLRTSPELHMKRLLAAGLPRIYQIGSCFREGEQGDRHNPEFTMLEWYRADADYLDILKDAEELMAHVAQRARGAPQLQYQGHEVDLSHGSQRFEVSERYRTLRDWDPATHWDADRFDLDMVTQIEPSLPKERPAALLRYPAEAAALARLCPGDPLRAERFELYVAGMELVNAFSELTDATEQRDRFEQAAQQRADSGAVAYPLDEAFLTALKQGMPPAGGAALGVDRLIMLLANTPRITDVRITDVTARDARSPSPPSHAPASAASLPHAQQPGRTPRSHPSASPPPHTPY